MKYLSLLGMLCILMMVSCKKDDEAIDVSHYGLYEMSNDELGSLYWLKWSRKRTWDERTVRLNKVKDVDFKQSSLPSCEDIENTFGDFEEEDIVSVKFYFHLLPDNKIRHLAYGVFKKGLRSKKVACVISEGALEEKTIELRGIKENADFIDLPDVGKFHYGFDNNSVLVLSAERTEEMLLLKLIAQDLELKGIQVSSYYFNDSAKDLTNDYIQELDKFAQEHREFLVGAFKKLEVAYLELGSDFNLERENRIASAGGSDGEVKGDDFLTISIYSPTNILLENIRDRIK